MCTGSKEQASETLYACVLARVGRQSSFWVAISMTAHFFTLHSWCSSMVFLVFKYEVMMINYFHYFRWRLPWWDRHYDLSTLHRMGQLHQQMAMTTSRNDSGATRYATVVTGLLFSMIKIMISIMFLSLYVIRYHTCTCLMSQTCCFF